jgi:hypothetical protein
VADTRSAAGEGSEPRVPNQDQPAQELANLIAQSTPRPRGFWRRRRRKTSDQSATDTTPNGAATPDSKDGLTQDDPAKPDQATAAGTGQPADNAAETPAKESEQPGTPSDDGPSPTAESTAPANGTSTATPSSTSIDTPSAEHPTAQPAEGATQPPDDATQANEDTAQSGEGTAQVGDGTAQAGDGGTQAGDGTSQAGEGAAQGGDGNDRVAGDSAVQGADGAGGSGAGGDVPDAAVEERPRVGVVYEPDESPDGFPLEYGNVIIGLPKQPENTTQDASAAESADQDAEDDANDQDDANERSDSSDAEAADAAADETAGNGSEQTATASADGSADNEQVSTDNAAGEAADGAASDGTEDLADSAGDLSAAEGHAEEPKAGTADAAADETAREPADDASDTHESTDDAAGGSTNDATGEADDAKAESAEDGADETNDAEGKPADDADGQPASGGVDEVSDAAREAEDDAPSESVSTAGDAADGAADDAAPAGVDGPADHAGDEAGDQAADDAVVAGASDESGGDAADGAGEAAPAGDEDAGSVSADEAAGDVADESAGDVADGGADAVGSAAAGESADEAAEGAVDGADAVDGAAAGGSADQAGDGTADGADAADAGSAESGADVADEADGAAEAEAGGEEEEELTAAQLAERLAAEQAAMALITALMKLRGVLAASRLPLEVVGADEARQQQKAMLDQLDDYLLPRLVQLEAPVLAVVGGSTGAGKSTLVNTVIGKVVSEPGVLRPTTRSPVLIHHPADADWFVGDRVLPGMARTSSDEPGGMEDAGQLRLVAADTVPRGLAILDAPDIDSVVEANRDLATQLLAAADLWLFVTTAARYSDAVPWEFLQSASDRSTAVAVVLDRAPSETIDDITGHLAQMLLERGLGDSPLFSIQETVVDGNGMLPQASVASIKDWLVDLAADAEARAGVVRRTLQGAVSAMVKKTPPFAEAVKAQADTAIELRSSVESAYDQGVKDIAKACQDGTLLRGEVLARWQEFVGTGELLKGLQSNAGRLRDRLKTSLGNKPAETRDVSDAIRSGLESLLREHATAAAERAEKAWQATAPGRQLLAAADAELANDDPGGSLGALSPEFPDAAARAVREWQAFVLEVIRKEGGARKSTARILEYGVNGLGLSLMVAVFARETGIPKGAEASAGAGSAVVGQRLLEAVFGDKAVQGMVDKAREDLDGKVHALMDAEFARYLAVLDQHPVDAETARLLTEAARAVEDCT